LASTLTSLALSIARRSVPTRRSRTSAVSGDLPARSSATEVVALEELRLRAVRLAMNRNSLDMGALSDGRVYELEQALDAGGQFANGSSGFSRFWPDQFCPSGRL
jgi:hypothetical protein